MKNKKNKHMTLDDRIEIQACLSKRMTFKAIAQRIGKDPTTISKEVKLHSKAQANGFTKLIKYAQNYLKRRLFATGVANAIMQVADIHAESMSQSLHKRNMKKPLYFQKRVFH